MRTVCSISVAAVLFSGCVLSIDRVIPESDTVFAQDLLGTWVNGDETAVITTRDTNDYWIEYTNSDGTGRFRGWLAHAGQHLVLQVQAAPLDDEIPDVYAPVLISGYLPVRLELNSDTLVVTHLEADSVKSAIGAGQLDLRFIDLNDGVVLTDETPSLWPTMVDAIQRLALTGETARWHRTKGGRQ